MKETEVIVGSSEANFDENSDIKDKNEILENAFPESLKDMCVSVSNH